MTNPPTPPILEVVNDPTSTPLAANAAGDIFVTEDGTVLLVSSTLRSRGTHLLQKRRWLVPPPSYPKA
jgi:hypothetical protein